MLAAPDQRRCLPDGMGVEMRTMRDGWGVRSAMRAGDGAAGSVLVLNGRGDFMEKYAELIHDLSGRGYGVASFDWRGQGGSGRLLGDARGHASDFAPWLGDLAEQVAWFRATLPPPYYAVAHSMGAHLLLRHLSRHPDFARAVLLSPMVGLQAAPIGPWLARHVAALACALGNGEAYAPGNGALARGLPGTLRQRRLTHDLGRYADEGWWLEQHPEWALGGVTNGWLNAAFASIDALAAPGVPEGIGTPLLILTAEGEALVDNAATVRLAARLPHARVRDFAGAGHELVREIDAIRLPVFEAIAEFLA
ncbi:alpha/beta fold hydrolase [Glacieibacterium frigidum]|nr:alpha/beta hydrolase [Glacieibacterium frigidum]